jgi:hypothetical protein
LIFEKAKERRTAWVIRENQKIYEVKPARKKLQWLSIAVYPQFLVKLRVGIVPVKDLNSKIKV